MATIVIHSRTRERISGTYTMEWSLHTGRRLVDGTLVMSSRLIDKEKARQIIDKAGLVECHRTKDGEIYETPQRDFKALFPRGIRTKEDMQKIENTDWL